MRDALRKKHPTHSRNWNLTALRANLAPDTSWPVLFELSSRHYIIPFNLVCENRLK